MEDSWKMMRRNAEITEDSSWKMMSFPLKIPDYCAIRGGGGEELRANQEHNGGQKGTGSVPSPLKKPEIMWISTWKWRFSIENGRLKKVWEESLRKATFEFGHVSLRWDWGFSSEIWRVVWWQTMVSAPKNDDFCIKNVDFCIKNVDFCVKTMISVLKTLISV